VQAYVIDQLELFYDLLPEKVRVQPEKHSPQLIRSKKHAPEYSRINPHHGNIHWLVADIDERVTQYTIYDAHLPEANIYCLDKETGTGHLYWLLESPVHAWSSQKQSKAYRYLDAIQCAFTDRIHGGDKLFTRQVSKNPLHSDWEIYQGTDAAYGLHDLAEFIPNLSQLRPGKDRQIELEDGEGRNPVLFKELRLWAYPNVKMARSVSYDVWVSQVLTRALSINTCFPIPLPLSEVRSTAKSVAKYIYDQYRPQKARGRDEAMITTEMELIDRQRLAAERTNASRKGSTEGKIVWAMEKLRAEGKRVSKSSVARIAGVHRNTIDRHYAHLLQG
jgi:hypothetical protein